MKKLDPQFLEDRALRDAARGVFMADVVHARTTFSKKGLAERVGGRIGDGAKDVFEVAKTNADDNRGIIAVLLGAILLWLAREPILEILGFIPAEDTDEIDEVANEPLEEASGDHTDKRFDEEAPETADLSPGEDDD